MSNEHPYFWLTLWLDKPVRVETDKEVGILVGLQVKTRRKVPKPQDIVAANVARPWRVVDTVKPELVMKGSPEDGQRYSLLESEFLMASEEARGINGQPLDMENKTVIYDADGKIKKVIGKTE
jgi:hypothetical protein